MKIVKVLLYTAVFILFIAGCALAYNQLANRLPGQELQTEQTGGPQTDGADNRIKAPDFTVVDADGNEVKLSDMEGMPIVLNFWASWCPPCKDEMPHFDTVYKELGGEVLFMMVDLVDGSRETVDKGSAYIAELGYAFPVYFDVNGEAAYEFAVQSIPFTLFIDSEGYLVTVARRAINEATLRKGIELIL